MMRTDTQLQQLLAERACEQLIYEYCRRVDFGNASAIAELFTEDGTWEGVDLKLEGRAQIREWFTQREGLSRRVSRHACTNLMINLLSEDEAESISYMVNYRHDRRNGDESLPAPLEVPKFVGELHDRFRRTPDGWQFSSRRVVLSFVRRRASA